MVFPAITEEFDCIYLCISIAYTEIAAVPAVSQCVLAIVKTQYSRIEMEMEEVWATGKKEVERGPRDLKVDINL